MKGPKSEDSGASLAAGAKAATVGRLVGERAFHFGPSTFAGAIASRTLAVNAPFAPGAASAANLTAQPALDGESALLPASRRPRPCQRKPRPTPFRRLQTRRLRRRSPLARARPQHIARASLEQPRTRPRAAGKSPMSRRLRRSPGLATSAAVHAPAESSGKAADGRPPDPVASAGAIRRRKQTCSAHSSRRLSPQGRRSNSTARRRAPDTQTSRRARARSPLAPRPRLRRSGRSTSIFRREASRMSR